MSTQLKAMLKATSFAVRYHAGQSRKGANPVPYVAHPLEVARILLEEGGVEDIDVLCAAILHDTLEDTKVTSEIIEDQFGSRVLRIVEEVTDDKDLHKDERKRLQVINASKKSSGAALVKLADKIANVRDVTHSPPNWDLGRRKNYIDWASQVVRNLPIINTKLLGAFDAAVVDYRSHSV